MGGSEGDEGRVAWRVTRGLWCGGRGQEREGGRYYSYTVAVSGAGSESATDVSDAAPDPSLWLEFDAGA